MRRIMEQSKNWEKEDGEGENKTVRRGGKGMHEGEGRGEEE